MIYKYENGSLLEVKPYDAQELDSEMKKIGVQAQKTRKDGKLYLECEQLTAEQITAIENKLKLYDYSKTKNLEIFEVLEN